MILEGNVVNKKEEKYTVPDSTILDGTKMVDAPPKFKCNNCNASTWCVYAPWVDGCDTDMEVSP
jgi:hypothetical protein